MVKVLSQLSPVERLVLKTEVVLVPDKNGPVLVPASSLVYDDAHWLTSRLRQHNLRLVHPEVGDEVTMWYLFAWPAPSQCVLQFFICWCVSRGRPCYIFVDLCVKLLFVCLFFVYSSIFVLSGLYFFLCDY